LGIESGGNSGQKGVQKRGDPDRQVGAFSVFGQGVYRNPVHF